MLFIGKNNEKLPYTQGVHEVTSLEVGQELPVRLAQTIILLPHVREMWPYTSLPIDRSYVSIKMVVFYGN